MLELLLQATFLTGGALDLPAERTVLDNGMVVIVAPDHSAPLIAVRLFYRVGSRDERPGESGLAHLFEHMMFNGTRKFGPKQFDRVLEQAGGAGNAFTTQDLTCYTTQVPPESLAALLELEADRMHGLSIPRHVLAREIQVVLEERRMSIEDDPDGALRALLMSHLYQAHPYRTPVLGWAADVRDTTVARCREFYARHYGPDRAVLVLAGDVTPEHGFALATKWFGGLARCEGTHAPPAEEPPRAFRSRVELRRPVSQPTLLIAFQGPAGRAAEHAALDLAQRLLGGGDSSRLHRRLVQRERLATQVLALHGWTTDPGPFTLHLTLVPGADVARVEAIVAEELAAFLADGAGDDELARARTACLAAVVRSLETFGGRAEWLGRGELQLGDHRAVLQLPERHAAVTAQQVRDAAGQYLRLERSATAVLLPLETR